MANPEDARKGRTISLYITDQEWDLLVRKVQEQGQEGTDQQVTLFAKQWAKAGMRMPIREELEQVLFHGKKMTEWPAIIQREREQSEG